MGSPIKELTFSLEDFPVKVIERIAKYLSTHDLNSCCACSARMREIFNDDLIWKKRCNIDLADYLEKTPCKVKPIFSIAPLKKNNHSLIPVSKWKVAFMRETHLSNNWRRGKYVKEEIKNNQSGPKQCANFHSFMSNDYIVAQFDNRFEVLDVKQFPALLVANVGCYDRGFKIKFWQNSIIVTVDSAVQVFQLDTLTNVCNIKHQFVFEDDDQIELTGLDQVKVNIVPNKAKPMSHEIQVGSMIVVIYQNESVMHVWNIETGLKIKKVQPFLINSQITDIASSSSSMNLIICLTGKSNLPWKVCGVYSLVSFEYLKFQEKIPKRSEITVNNNFIAVWNLEKNNIEIFDYKLSSKVMSVESSMASPRVFRNGFVHEHGNELVFINASSRTVQKISKGAKEVSWFEVLCDKFIQIQGFSYDSPEIWEISDDLKTVKTTSMKIYFQMCAYFFNKSRTRYIVRERVGNVMHFW